MKCPVTLYPNKFAKSKKDAVIDFSEIANPKEHTVKTNMPLLALVKLGDGHRGDCVRYDDNIEAVYGAALDYDNTEGDNISIEQARDALDLAGIRAWLYTTPTHTPEHPKWRALLPYSTTFIGDQEMMKDRLRGAVHQGEQIIGCVVGKESRKISQSFFYGRLKGSPYSAFEIVGDRCIDQTDNLDHIGNLLRGPEGREDRLSPEESLENIQSGEEMHESLLALTARWVTRGLSRAEVIAFAQDRMEMSDSPRDERWHTRNKEIERMVDGAFAKLKRGEWELMTPAQAKADEKKEQKELAVKKKGKAKPMTFAEFSSAFAVSQDYLDSVRDSDYLYRKLFIRGQLIAIVGEPSSGKTTVMEFIAADIAKTGSKVTYINADISGAHVIQAHRLAKAGGYTLLVPDANNKSMADVVTAVQGFVEQNLDLRDHVFIFDTLKKMTDVINKNVAKDLYTMLRSLTTGCGATVICLAHTNKYGLEGWPMYEGTADLRSDFDQITLLMPEKNDYGTVTTSFYTGQGDECPWAKSRGVLSNESFLMDNRNVTRLPQWVNTVENRKTSRTRLTMLQVYTTIAQAIHNGPAEGMKKDELIRSGGGHGWRVMKRGIEQGMDEFWVIEVGEKNAHFHKLTEKGRELLQTTSANDDFDDEEKELLS